MLQKAKDISQYSVGEAKASGLNQLGLIENEFVRRLNEYLQLKCNLATHMKGCIELGNALHEIDMKFRALPTIFY
jgi:hypothetical protein